MLDSLRQTRRLALKAFETYLPPALGYPLSRLVDPFFRRSALAAGYCERLQLEPDLVMYESYNGRDFAGNAYALFRHLIDRNDYAHLRHVIAVPSLDHPKVLPFRNHPRVILVKVDTPAYIRYAESCTWFINNASWKPYLIKRSGQTWVYTWHSTLLKKLAVDKGAPWEARNVTRALVAADYFISPNRYTTELLLASHGAGPFMDGMIAEFGYPRNDLTINADRISIKRMLGLSEGEQLVVFAPTWRGEQNAVDTVAETLDQRQRLQDLLPAGYRVVVKFHTMVYRFLNAAAMKYCPPLSVDANELLAAADYLVTDYSGIFFDYLSTGRPVIFFAPDREEYARAKNGFYLDLETLPGPMCQDLGSVASAILHSRGISERYAQAYAEFRALYLADDDGMACQRTIDLVFGAVPEPRTYRIPHTRKRLLFYPGPMNPNGVTTSFLALAGRLDYDAYDVAVLLPDDARNRVFQAGIDRRASIFYQSVPDAFTASEYSAHARFIKRGSRSRDDLPIQAYRSSMGRIFYGVEFHSAVNFHGYQPADAAKLALGVVAARKVIFLHNDLNRDRIIKQPQLHAVFSTYKYYDRLFCVSADSLAANLVGMAVYTRGEFGDDVAPLMDYAPNLIAPESIRSRALEALPGTIPEPSPEMATFMTIGRLSPEKNHARLLEAFRLVVDTCPGSRLYIVGDGKTAGTLRQLARSLRLGESTVFIPFMANPYPLFKACDCFVLSSDIEGQPITILEALTLGKPVISTDIAGPHDLLCGGEGTLVAASAEALASAMITFIRNGRTMDRKDFDPFGYVESAASRFAEKVLEGKA
ncbi:MAG: hypothetical protein A2Y38_00225 [Spirochaetes bacterium GWB1_59_5]|nr:MAG: hypothetical protein A2Y38_00225 [Spirochaetes bacterium GWB1_59_5]